MLGNLFRYEDGLLYKKRKNGSKWTCCNDAKPSTTGYIHVKVNGKMMLLHRLVYHFHHPDWNIRDNCRDNSIDHINGNKLDNRIENLRVVTHSQNKQNMTHVNGKPIRGVSFHKRYNMASTVERKWKTANQNFQDRSRGTRLSCQNGGSSL
jgi:hypothetical protein